MSPLFQTGDFTLHSGEKSNKLIDCSALTDEDIRSIAAWLHEMIGGYRHVYSIPRGGDRLANAMFSYVSKDEKRVLIVDDVLTTGESMLAEYDKLSKTYSSKHIIGAVIFARRPTPYWVTALWNLPEGKKL